MTTYRLRLQVWTSVSRTHDYNRHDWVTIEMRKGSDVGAMWKELDDLRGEQRPNFPPGTQLEITVEEVGEGR